MIIHYVFCDIRLVLHSQITYDACGVDMQCSREMTAKYFLHFRIRGSLDHGLGANINSSLGAHGVFRIDLILSIIFI